MNKNIKMVILRNNWLVVVISLIMMLSGCIGQQNASIEETSLSEIKIPIWNKTDTQIEKLEKGTPIYEYTIELKDKPSIYEGVIPLEFTAAYPPWGVGSGLEYPLYYDFNDFVNYFVYSSSILVGAQTYDKNGNLLAEASFSYAIKDDKQVIEVTEIHYSNNKSIFRCKSLIDPYDGGKIKEIETKGRKKYEYYFMWPVAPSAIGNHYIGLTSYKDKKII